MLPSHVIPKGNLEELSSHNNKATLQHLELVTPVAHSKRDLESSERVLAITAANMQKQKQAIDRQITAIHNELARLTDEVGVQTDPLKEKVIKLQSSLVDLKEDFSELHLQFQTLQATSYNGEFIWKIREVAQKVREARTGKITSLYSPPFYTSRFGYKLCLRLFLNGDGIGKDTHLSFFVIIMKWYHNAMLSWPFLQKVTMMLLDQDKRENIAHVFRPDPSSSSFFQPKKEMNIASGFPKFAPLSVLSNPRYVRNDTLYLKVIVDKTGLDQP